MININLHILACVHHMIHQLAIEAEVEFQEGGGARERGATPHQLAIEAEVAFSGHN